MFANIVLLALVSTIILFSTVNFAFAVDPAPYFDQPRIAIEHSSVLTITNSTETNSQITATVISGSNSAVVNLYKVGNTAAFKSNFINFTNGQTGTNPANPRLHVDVNSTIDVKYYSNTTPTLAQIISSDGTLPNEYDSVRTYGNAAARGCSSAYGGDSDKDGICNNWEVSPYLINYPSGSTYKIPCESSANYTTNKLGDKVCPSPTKKDIYVEIDWVAGHKPNIEALELVVSSFNNASQINGLPNPFQLHIFVDEEISDHITLLQFPGYSGAPGFDHIKAKKFGNSTERETNWTNNYVAKGQIFNYYIWGHSIATNPTSSGIAELGGNDGGVTLGTFDGAVGSLDQQAGTFMHELGHNLNLEHGGSSTDTINCKPNLLSVMNYAYQFKDLSPRTLDYSRSAIGTNTSGSTSLGMESALQGQPINLGGTTGQTVVYGIGGGSTTTHGLPVDGNAGNWPNDWHMIRTMSDSQNNVICSTPNVAQSLDGFNQWISVDLSAKSSHWRDGRSSNSTQWMPTETNSVYIWTDKYDYTIDDKISVNGTITNNAISDATVTIQAFVIGNDTNPIINFTIPLDNGTFKTKLKTDSSWLNSTYTIKALYNSSSYETSVYLDTDNVNFKIKPGDWCLTKEEADKQKKKEKNLRHAPLCTESEITTIHVKAARSIHVDRLIGKINELTNIDSKDEIINKLESIRSLVLSDNTIGAVHNYNTLRDTISDNVKNIKDQDNLFKILDQNVNALSHSMSVISYENFAGKNIKENNIRLSPLKQDKHNIDIDLIQCNVGLEFVQKYDESPACVKLTSKQPLINRGWIIQ